MWSSYGGWWSPLTALTPHSHQPLYPCFENDDLPWRAKSETLLCRVNHHPRSRGKQPRAVPPGTVLDSERLVIYCQTTGVSAAHATHCATYCTPCRPLIRAFSGWIRTPPPTFSIQEQLLRSNEKQFRGGLVFEARRRLYHSTLGRGS